MPYRRSRSSRKTRTFNKKRYGRKAFKRTIQKMRTQGLTFYKLKAVLPLASDAGGVIQFGLSTSNPSAIAYINGAGPSVAVEDWTNLTSLYDSYRVCGIKVKFIPLLPNSTTASFYPLYSIVDYDSQPAPVSTVAGMVQYDNIKVHNIYRPFKRYIKVPKTLSTNTTASYVGFGWWDMANPGASGSLYFYGTTYTASATYGTFLITYYISVKNRR